MQESLKNTMEPRDSSSLSGPNSVVLGRFAMDITYKSVLLIRFLILACRRSVPGFCVFFCLPFILP
jgi:hypothetical protein